MKKNKAILTFEVDERKFWSRETGERRNTDYACLATLPDQEEIIFATTMGGNLIERFEKNVHDELLGMELLKEKRGKKF